MGKIAAQGFLDADILWFTDPRHISIQKYVRPRKVFYRCVDDLEKFPDIPRGLAVFERKLVASCDAVFFTSKVLLDKYKDLNENSVYLPNGCDFASFNQPRIDEPRKLDYFRSFYRPDRVNVLYMGSVSNWFDFEAVRVLAADRRVNIVIVGPHRSMIPSDLKIRENVRFTGPFEYKYMPYFTKLADCAFIPFVKSAMTDAVNPIKLYEFCAAGLPVLSSSLESVESLRGPFITYKTREELGRCVDAVIKASGDGTAKKRIEEFARLNSWESRYEVIRRYLSQVV